MRVHAKCSLGLFVELSETFLWKQSRLIFVCRDFLFFLTDENQHIFLHIFLCWQQILFTHVMIMARCAVCRIAMALPVNIAQMKYSISLVYSKASTPANIFFTFCFLSDDPLTGPDMLAFCVFHSSLRTRWCAACLSGRSEMSCIDVNCCCLIFRGKNSIARMHPLATMLIISSERHVRVARIRDEQCLAW